MSTLIVSDGYGIAHDKSHNRIVITLPPTARTANNTVDQIVSRKEEITDAEAMLILVLVQKLFKEEDE